MIEATVKGSAALVIKNLEGLPVRLQSAIATGLSRGLLEAARISQQNYLSGPRPGKLDVRTRRLRDSIATEVVIDSNQVIGRIGTNVQYAAFHEFGFHGVMNVRAHTRVIGFVSGGRKLPTTKEVKKSDGTPGFRQDIRPGFVRAGLSGYQSLALVKAHDRRVDYAGRPFVKPALQEALPVIEREVKADIEKAKDG